MSPHTKRKALHVLYAYTGDPEVIKTTAKAVARHLWPHATIKSAGFVCLEGWHITAETDEGIPVCREFPGISAELDIEQALASVVEGL